MHVVISSNNDSGHDRVTIIVAEATELSRYLRDESILAVLVLVEIRGVRNDISDGLCVGSRSTTATINFVCDSSQFVGDSVCHICSRAGARISANDNTTIKFNSHDCGLK